MIRRDMVEESRDEMVTPSEREDEVERLLDVAVAWARNRPEIHALALAGSWARRRAQLDSDVDLIVLTEDVDGYTSDTDWISELGASVLLDTRSWGAITERRLAMPSGLEVEVDICSPEWASTEPLDPGTSKVVADGFRVLYDPAGQLAAFAYVKNPGCR